jgi:putative ABC transport system permease protein
VRQCSAPAPRVSQTRSLRERDVAALANPDAAADIASVSPLRVGSAVIRYRQNQYSATVTGTTPAFLQVRNDHIAVGRMFTEQENHDRARVVVIAPKIVNYLFGGSADAAVGSEVHIGRLTFTVIGVLAPAGDDQDHFAPMPLNTSRALFGGIDTLNGIGVVATSGDRVTQAICEVYNIMDRQHDVEGGPQFRDYTLTANLDQITKLKRYVTLFGGLTLIVGLIALAVGTLGVANIMLVTVTHRTIEIGIRRAIGARRSAITKQFLLEAIVLAGLGGLVGAAVGTVLVYTCGPLTKAYLPGISAPWVAPWAVAGTFAISLLIGLVAGTYPALRASRLHPIDALRF